MIKKILVAMMLTATLLFQSEQCILNEYLYAGDEDGPIIIWSTEESV